MKPQRPYRALRAIVGTVVVLAVVGLWAHAQLTGQSLDSMWQLATLVIVLAGALAVFGKGTFEAATSAAKEIGGDGGQNGGGGADASESPDDN